MKKWFSLMKNILHIWSLLLAGAFFSLNTSAQIVLHDATDVTQTKATLSADFSDLSSEHGFQYKYGTLPEIDDFSRLALAELSDPVLLTTTDNAWSARSVKGWVESKSGLPSGGSSTMSAMVSFTEQTEVTFEWSVDSEDGVGVLSFIVDGTTVESISGLVGFTEVTYIAQAGPHTLEWQYKKNGATNVGLDIGMVRNINLQNTTEGTWNKYSETIPSGISMNAVSVLTPNRDYLFRAYQTKNGVREYSTIKHFKTLPVILGDLTAEMTQTTATLSAFLDAGDAPIEPDYQVRYIYLDSNQKALLHKDSEPVSTLTKTEEWKVVDGVMSCTTLFSSAKLTVSFTLTDTATVSFDWAVKGVNASSRKSIMSCCIDSKSVTTSLTANNNDKFTVKHYSQLLNVGPHTITWTPSVGYGSDYATVSNFRIANTKINPDVLRNVQSISNYMSDNAVLCKLTGLRPDTKYMAQLRIKSTNEYKDSTERILFRTQTVFADTLPVTNLSQASATIRGKVDGGDAIIHATGLQYKDVSGTRWTEYPKETTDTLLTHNLTRLRPNTKYNYRSYIQALHNDTTWSGSQSIVQAEELDTVFSEVGEFITLAVEARKPVIGQITQQTAELQGKVIFGDASIYQRGIQFRKAGNAEWEDVEDGGNDSIFTLKKTGLLANTAYEARTYIQPAGSDIIYSDIFEFTTLAVEARMPVLVDRTQNSVELQGKVIFGDASIYQRGMQYRKAGNTEWEDVEDGGNDSIFTLNMTGLLANTAYEARTYIQPVDSDIIYSDILSFRTKDNEAYADYASDVYQRSAVIHGHWSLEEGNIFEKSLLLYEGNSLKKRYDITSTDTEFALKATDLEPDHTYKAIVQAYHATGGVCTSADINYTGMSSTDTLFAKALMNEVNENIQITRGSSWSNYGWKQGDGQFGYVWYTGPYNYANDDLKLTFTLANPATVSFECKVTGFNNSYSKTYYNYLDLYVDGNKVETISAEDGEDFRIISLELTEGAHTLTWDPYVWNGDTYKAYLRNLSIPNVKVMKPLTFRTASYVKDNRVTGVTQTKAHLSAALVPTYDTYEQVGFCVSGEGMEQQTVPAKVINDSLIADMSNLLPGGRYYYQPFVVVDGRYYNGSSSSFNSKNIALSIYIDKATQTTVALHVENFDAGDANISNLQYAVRTEDLYVQDFTNYPKDGIINLKGLAPDTYYYLAFSYKINEVSRSTNYWYYYVYLEKENRWDYKETFCTLPITFSTWQSDIAQTSSLIHFTADCGDATFISYGVEIVDTVLTTSADSLRLENLDFVTTYDYRPFVETKEGGRQYLSKYSSAEQIRQFKTLALSLSTLKPSCISNRSATLNGIIYCDSYSSAEFGCQWKQMEGWNSEPAFTKGVKKEDGTISVALVNGMLEPNTDYQYRTAVRYKGQMFYADEWETFRTELEYVYYPASVYTVFRTDRENNRLILCGYYVAGSETVTSQGYEYWNNKSNVRSHDKALAQANNVTKITTDESMQYALDLKTLADGNYSVRAFVTTTSGTTLYGETLTFGVRDDHNAIEGVETDNIYFSTSGSTLIVHNALSLDCSIYSLNGLCVTRRKLTGWTEKFELHKHDIYIVKLSNGKSYKIKL